MKRNIKESEGLSDYQKGIVVDMVKADFECGHPMTGEDMRGYFEEDEDLKDNVDAAVDYYVELVQMGPGGFYEEYPDLDWDEDFVAEYGDLEESEESDEESEEEESDEDKEDSEDGEKQKLKEDHEWSEFDQFKNSDEYLPPHGDGDNKGTQAATALCKLIYKWFNDGDVFDNHYGMEGWANDISGSANWLYHYVDGTRPILARIKQCHTDAEYTDLLFDLISLVDPMIPLLATFPKVGDAYNEDGPYSYYEPPRCPNCGGEADEWDLDRYGMCADCYEYEQEEEEEEYDDDEDFDE